MGGFPATSIFRFPRRELPNGTFLQLATFTFQLNKLPKEVDIAFECSTLYTTPSTFVVNGMVMSIGMRCVQQGCSRGQDLPRPRHGWPRPRPSKLGLEAGLEAGSRDPVDKAGTSETKTETWAAETKTETEAIKIRSRGRPRSSRPLSLVETNKFVQNFHLKDISYTLRHVNRITKGIAGIFY